MAFALGSAVEAAPSNGRVVEGSGSIKRSGAHTDIHQHSDFLATRWDSFNIAAHESVQAHQPSSTSRLLIRVDGGATNIAGSYSSNGITILENQNGVQFSRGAIVNVGGLLATSARISGVDGAHWQLNRAGGGAIVNHGEITAGAGGAILAAVKVQNTGDITSKGGDVALGAGSSFTVDFAGSMVGFEVRQAASGASLANTGKIEAQGGIVQLSAHEAQAVRTNVVSLGGVVRATKMERRGGVVYLSGGGQGIAEVSGDVQADEKVQATGEYVVVREGAFVKAPEILVGGDYQGKGDVPTARRTLVERTALLDAGINGRVIVWSDETTWFDGDISAPGGFAEVSGKKILASVNLTGIDVDHLLLDPEILNIVAVGDDVIGDITADVPSADGTTNISVSSINNFTGASLTLSASRSLRVRAAISHANLNLTLRTENSDVAVEQNIELSADINVGTGTLNLESGVITIPLVNGAAVIRTLTASGLSTSSIPGLIPSSIHLRFTRAGVASLAEGFAGGMARVAFGEEVVRVGSSYGARAAEETATDCSAQQINCKIGRINENVMATSARLISTNSIAINIGTGNLDFTNAPAGNIVIDSGSVSIKAGGILIGGRGLTIIATTGGLTLNTGITSAGLGDVVALSSLNGDLILGGEGSEVDFALESRALTLNAGGEFIFAAGAAPSAVTAQSIELSGPNLPQRTPSASIITFTPRPNGRVIGGDEAGPLPLWFANNLDQPTQTDCSDQPTNCLIRRGGRDLEISTESLTATSSITIDIENGTLTFSGAGAITISAREVAITASMINLNGRDLTITSGGGRLQFNLNTDIIAANTLTIGEMNESLTLTLDAARTLAGTNISLISAEEIIIDQALHLHSTDRLILTSNIDAQGAASDLTLGSGGMIVLQDMGEVELTSAGNLTIGGEITTALSLLLNASGFLVLNADIVNTGDHIHLFSTRGIILNGDRLIQNDSRNVFVKGEIDDSSASGLNLAANDSLTITATGVNGQILFDADVNLGTGALSLTSTRGIDRGAPHITLTGGDITLPSSFTNNGVTRSFTVMANGTLTLNGTTYSAPDSIILSGTQGIMLGSQNTRLVSSAITITASALDANGRDLTVIGGGGTLTLNLNANITNVGTLTIGEAGHSLTLIPDAARTLAGTHISLLSSADIIVQQSLSLHSGTTLTLNVPLLEARGEDRHLTLGSSGTMNVVGGGSPIFRSAHGNLTINAALTGSNLTDLFLIANTSALVLNADITGGSFLLILEANRIALSGSRAIEADDGIFLNGMIDESGDQGNDSLTLASGGAVTLRREINLGTGDLTITGGGGSLTLNLNADIKNAGTITIGEADQRLSLTLDAARTLTSTNIMLLSSMSINVRQSLHLHARGTLTLNSNLSTTSGNDLTLGLPEMETEIEPDTAPDMTPDTAPDMTPDTEPDTEPAMISLINVASYQFTAGGKLTINNALIAASSVMIDLEATDSDGVIELNADITGTSASILLDGTGGIVLNGDRTLEAAGNITLRGAIDESGSGGSDGLTVNATTASARILLGSDINLGACHLTLTGIGGITLESDIQLTAGDIELTGAIDESAAMAGENGEGGNDGLSITATGALTLNSNINTGTGDLTLRGGTITLNRNSDMMTIQIEGGTTTLTGALTSTDNILVAINGAVIRLNSDIDAGAGNLSLGDTGGMIILGGDITLMGRIVTFVGGVDESAAQPDETGKGGGDSLAVVAGEFITIFEDINLGAGTLTLTAGPAHPGGEILAATALTLTASTVRVEQNSIFSQFNLITYMTGVLTLKTAAAQSVHGWMAKSGRDLKIIAGGDITIDDIDVGTGDLILDSDTKIVLDEDATLTAGAITFVSAIEGGGNGLTINAGGMLTLNSDIDLGAGDLMLTAHAFSVPAAITITADPTVIEFTDSAIQIDSLPEDISRITFQGDAFPNYILVQLQTACVEAVCVFNWNEDNTPLSPDLDADTSITINADKAATSAANDGRLMFSGTGAITIDAPTITINAALIDTQGRQLTITTSDGALTLNAVIHSFGGLVGLTSMGGAVILGGDINAGTGDIALSGGAGISLMGDTQLIAAAITLTGTIDESLSGNDGLTVTATGALTLNSNIDTGTGDLFLTGESISLEGDNTTIALRGEDITLAGALTSTGPALTAQARNVLRLNDDINIGAEDILTLTGVNGITLGSALITLTGGDVSLTGAIDESAAQPDASGKGGGDSLTVNASDDINIAKNINLGMGTLTLIAGTASINGDIKSGSPIPILTASALTLTQDVAFAAAPRFTLMTSALTLRTGATQLMYVWMAEAGRTLSLITDNRIEIVHDVNVGTGDLTLSTQTSIVLAADITLMGGAITLTGPVNGSKGDRNLTITATDALTLNHSAHTGTGDLILTGSSIKLNEMGDPITLTGGNVSLTGAIDESGMGGNNDLTINASVDITLNGDINLGTGALAVAAGMGLSGGSIINDGASRSLIAQSVSLAQDAAFASTELFTFTLAILLLDTSASQTVHPWMTRGDHAFSLTSAAAIRVEENVSTGGRDLTLTGDDIIFLGGARTLSGANIALTGAATSMADLTIFATGTLALNSNIIAMGSTSDLSITGDIIVGAAVELTSGHDLTISGAISVAGTNGDLSLTAGGTAELGGNVNLGTGALMIGTGSSSGLIGDAVITAGTINIIFYNDNIASVSDVAAIGTTITFANSVEPIYRFGTLDCKNHHPCVIEGSGEIIVKSTLTDATSITITATGEDSKVSFGDTGVITLTAPEVVITADIIDLGGRALMIVDPGGAALTIGGDITGAGTITVANSGTLAFVGDRIVAGGRIDIIAAMISTVNRANDVNISAAHSLSITASKDLFLMVSTIDVGSTSGGDLTLGITGGTGNISAASAVDITANVVFLTHGPDNQNAMTFALLGSASHVGALNVNVHSVDQQTADWMFAVGRATAITNQNGTITMASAISHHGGAITLIAANSTNGGINIFENITNLTDELTLNSGVRPIVFGGTDVRKVIAAGITLSAGSVMASSDLILEAGTAPLVLNSGIDVGANNLTLDGSVINLNSSITLAGADIRLAAPVKGTFDSFTFTIEASSILTLDNNIDLGAGSLIFSGAGIELGGDITLEGMAIALTGAIRETADDLRFTITAGGVVTLNSDIELTGDTGTEISITANGNGGEIINGGSARTLTANRVNLVQSSQFGSAAPFVLISVDILNLTTDTTQAQAVWAWMVNGHRNLSLTSTGAIEIRTDISTGAGDLALDGASIALPVAGHFTLSGFSIDLTGAIDADARDLTINASGRLTLNSDINLAAGALAITAERIAVPNIISMTASAITMTFTGVGIENASEGFVGGQTSLDQVIFSTSPEYIFSELALGCDDSAVCQIGNGTVALNNVSPSLSASSSITIDAGNNPLTFAGTDAITITAPTIEITASMINIGGRNLTITSTGGALTLNAGIADTSSQTVMLSATGALTLGGNVDIRAGAVILSGGSIELDTDITLTGVSISLTGAIDESGIGGNDNLTVRLVPFSSGSLSISNDINLGTGNLILLANTRDLILGGTRTLTGGDISLTGRIDQSGLNGSLTVNASGMLTLNDDIDLGSNSLVLSSTSGILLIGNVTLTSPTITITAPMIDANGSNLTLTGGGAALTLNLNADITDAHNLTIGQASQNLTLNLDAARTLAGTNIMLLSSTAISVSRSLRLDFSGALTLNSDLSTTGMGNDLTLGPGSGSAGMISLSAGMKTLASDGDLIIEGALSGSGALSLMADGAIMLHAQITLVGATGSSLTLTGSSITLNGVGLLQASGSIELTGMIDETLSGNENPSGHESLKIIAGGDITLNSDINLGTGFLVLAAGGGSSVGNINDGGATRVLTAQGVSLKQDGAFGVLAPFTLTSVEILNLSTSTDQTVHDWMTDGDRFLRLKSAATITVGENIAVGTSDLILDGAAINFIGARTLSGAAIMLGGDVTADADLTITASGELIFDGGIDTGTNLLSLTGAAILIIGDSGGTRTLTGGNITLTSVNGVMAGGFDQDGDFNLGSGATNLTITASGELSIAANIAAFNILTLRVGTGAIGNGGVLRTLAASTVSLTQVDMFAEAALFTFGADTDALVFTTEMMQDVHDWMIAPNRNLALTSSLSVRVAEAIGADLADRDLGAGDLTLTSTGSNIRILADTATVGNLTLNGSTGIDLSGAARTLEGAAVMLTGAATSDEDLGIIGGGTLTLNSDIDIGTNTLILRGAAIRLTGASGGTRTLTAGPLNLNAVGGVMVGRVDVNGVFSIDDGPALNVIASGVLTIAADITVHDSLTLQSGEGAIGNGGAAVTLTASTVSLTQVESFGSTPLFEFNLIPETLSLNMTGPGPQRVYDWMAAAIVDGGSLVVSNLGRVLLESDIDLGASDITLMSDIFFIRVRGDITTSGNITLSGTTRQERVAIRFDNAEHILTGSNILLEGNVRTDGNGVNSITITASGTLSLRHGALNIGTSNLALTGRGGILLFNPLMITGSDTTFTGTVSSSDTSITITTTGNLTLNGDINTADIAAGDLSLTGATIRIAGASGTTRSLFGRDITLTATNGIMIGRVDGEGFHTDLNVTNLDVMARGALRIAGDIISGSDVLTGGSINLMGGGMTPITFAGARTLSGTDITLTGAATGTADLSLTARGILTLNDDITLTGAGLTLALSGAGSVGNGGTATILTASSVSLTQADAFAATALFGFGADTDALMFITEAAQDVHNWMIDDGRNLAITSALRVSVTAAIGGGVMDRDIGDGNLTLTSTGADIRIAANISTTGNITLSGVGSTGVDLSGAARTLEGENFTLNGRARSDGADIIITANSVLTLNETIIAHDRSDSANNPSGDLSLTAATIRIAGASGTTRRLFGRDITLTAANGIMIGRVDGEGFHTDLNVTGLNVVARGALRIAADIMAGNDVLTGGRIRLVGGGMTPITFTGVRTLSGTDIIISGDATGTADLSLTARGILTLNDDIALTGAGLTLALSGAGSISNGGTATTLTASTVSLTQVEAFSSTPLFEFNAIPETLSLNMTGPGAQRVYDWMAAAIVDGGSLVVSNLGRVLVESDIDLGSSDITLMSDIFFIRVRGDITTSGDITLSGTTRQERIAIRFDNAEHALTGRNISLMGNARTLSTDGSGVNNVAITASGTLTLNSDIYISAGALTLRSASPIIFGTGVELTADAFSFDPVYVCDESTINPRCTSPDIYISVGALTLTSTSPIIFSTDHRR